jgi:glycogen debranching enzyme
LTANGLLISKEDLGIKRERIIANDRLACYDLISFYNYGLEPIAFPVSLSLAATFDDVFAVRGMPPQNRGTLLDPAWEHGVLTFAYAGSDAIQRRLDVYFSPTPSRTGGTTAYFRLRIPPRAYRRLLITLVVDESAQVTPTPDAPSANGFAPVNVQSIQTVLRRSSDEWMAGETEIRSSSLALNAIIERSLRDLRVLRSRIGPDEYFAAGVP